ncbi:MAG: hypothetical protein L6R38_006856 [Xanthoria sp. 2 TBL-2021]|nr:MAG: hypothetical protein L6R38_006856 [Xanthoria sp. 2 TBL-2021]
MKRRRIIPVRRRINNRARNQRPDKRRRFPNDGKQREEKEFLAPRRDFGDHDLRVGIPGADEEAVEDLIEPDFPDVVEPEGLRPDANHALGVEDDDADHHGREHGFGAQGEFSLDLPEGVDAEGLGGDADEEEGCDDGYDYVEGIAEEEIADYI